MGDGGGGCTGRNYGGGSDVVGGRAGGEEEEEEQKVDEKNQHGGKGRRQKIVQHYFSDIPCLHNGDIATVGVSVKEGPQEAIIVLLDVHGVGYNERVSFEELRKDCHCRYGADKKHSNINKKINKIKTRKIQDITLLIAKATK